MISEAEQEDELRRGSRERTATPACRAWTIRAAVDEADEQDEEADADADGPLEGERDGVHDRLAEADQHEDRDHDAFEHDDAHRVLGGAGPRAG